jgi:Flp pilus assembly protein TadD
MEILFNGHKQQTFEGGVTQTNAFKDTMDRVIHNNQLDERLENLERAKNYSDFNMERAFTNMNIHQNMPMNLSQENFIKMNMNMNNIQELNQENPLNYTNNLQMNEIRHNNFSNFTPMNMMNRGIHPSLIEFNKQLIQENTNLKEETKTETGNDIYKDIIEVMESQDDERHQKSEFLKFIKKLQTGEIKLNEKDNDIEISDTYKPDDNLFENTWQKIENNMNMYETGLDTGEYEEGYENEGLQEETQLMMQNNPFLELTNNDLIEDGQNFVKSGELVNARLAFEAEVTKNPENSEGWYLLGKIHTENDRDDLAMQCFNNSLQVDPFNADSLLALGISCTNEFDEFDAMRHLKNWIKLHHVYNKYYEEGNPLLNDDFIKSQIDKTEYDEDIVVRNKQLEQMKHNFYNEMCNLMEYIAQNEKLVDSDLCTALGIAHFIPHNYDRAIECFRKAVEINPKDYNAWNKLGAILAHSKMDAEAINTYKKALEINPHYVRCLTNLGLAYLNLDNYQESRNAFLTTLKLYPDLMSSWSYLKTISVFTKNIQDYELVQNKDLTNLLNKYNL